MSSAAQSIVSDLSYLDLAQFGEIEGHTKDQGQVPIGATATTTSHKDQDSMKQEPIGVESEEFHDDHATHETYHLIIP